MDFLVRCIMSKMEGDKWVLQAGLVYKAKVNNEKVSIENHEKVTIEVDLYEFNRRCKIIRKLP
jgi:hypothetical protein